MATAQAQVRSEWSIGWALVMAATIGFSFNSVMTAATGLFIKPLGEEFGWSRTVLTMGTPIASIASVLLSPLMGILIDRWGSRRIALPGLVIFSVSIAAFGLANGSVAQWVTLWVVYALASLMVKSTVWITAVSGMFNAQRGLAVGVTMAGAAIAQIVVPPLTNALIDNMGWRNAFTALGFGWGGISFLACALFLFDARDRDRRARKLAPDKPPASAQLRGLTLNQAWRNLDLWKIAISTLIIMTISIALLVHQYELLAEVGVSRTNAAFLASAAGFAGIAGKLMTGWLMDRWHARWVGGITLAVMSLTFIFLLEPFRSFPLIVVAMLINGYSGGAKLQICGYLTSRYAGMLYFGTIFGFMASVIAGGSGLGPLIGGMIFDSYGNYTPLFIIGIIGSLISGALLASLGAYPDWGEKNLNAR